MLNITWLGRSMSMNTVVAFECFTTDNHLVWIDTKYGKTNFNHILFCFNLYIYNIFSI